MNIAEIREKILTDGGYVEQQLEQFLVYYNLKYTLRWGRDNEQKDESESVAEHVYGMNVLSEYFLPLYPELDALKVKQLITWHDMSEALVDDMTTRTKTDLHRQAEADAEETLIKNAAPQLSEILSKLLKEYNQQETAEAKFVRALDKLEPATHMYFVIKTTDNTHEDFKSPESNWTLQQFTEYQEKYVSPFDLLWVFDKVLIKTMDEGGLFLD